jgi:hypothetical protein
MQEVSRSKIFCSQEGKKARSKKFNKETTHKIKTNKYKHYIPFTIYKLLLNYSETAKPQKKYNVQLKSGSALT